MQCLQHIYRYKGHTLPEEAHLQPRIDSVLHYWNCSAAEIWLCHLQISVSV